MPSIKSKAAFQITIQGLMPSLFMWTITTPVAEDIELTIKRWHDFTRGRGGLLDVYPSVAGLRVFEMHKFDEEGRSHGLHIHFVVQEFLDVNLVRKLALLKGFGRIHVVKIKRNSAKYLGKYLSKERPECLKGKRLWAAFGNMERVYTKDIIVDSEFNEAYKSLCVLVKGFTELHVSTRMRMALEFKFGGDIQKCLEAANLFRGVAEEMQEHITYEEAKYRDDRREAGDAIFGNTIREQNEMEEYHATAFLEKSKRPF